jgi:hypothetical protein
MVDEGKFYDGRQNWRDQKSPEEAASLADKDREEKPEEFLREIYKEAYNTHQWPEDRNAKLIAKHSAILVRILSDHHKIHKSIRMLTGAVCIFTLPLVIASFPDFIKSAVLFLNWLSKII